MTNRGTWMQHSLERSANLCLDVLKCAKRREVNWPAECHVAKFRDQAKSPRWPLFPQILCVSYAHAGWYDDHQGMRSEQAAVENTRLETAFSTMVEFMARTTAQCGRFYSHKPACSCRKNEVNHVCRYHGRNALETLWRPRSPAKRELFPSFTVSPPQGSKCSKDVHIEVSPGTYSISTHSHGSEQTAPMVKISPGQSVDVVFIP
ncbi:A-kinase-interacting protein 1-like [Ambystoma mexicanum]|uniref:A-kinase-interacting protein 1-like n=1 Tax=Ambystoma mexicanum TaxID=8296 RepID=UPI0037E7260A